MVFAALTALFCPQARTVSGRARVPGGFEDVFSLEVLGPVLPHSLHALTLLLGPAQRGAFRALLSPHEPSAAFNAAPPQVRTQPRQRTGTFPPHLNARDRRLQGGNGERAAPR